ncbi:bifunctional adenosylcobinamide kinase/adenosylcobinamide-phosphate guanylyltransferase [Ferrimonas aestuarii]|uniref:Bifunctional adenosylcobalamin biosynthesis protein n=1 Tax=Ferrimonas aestuarii TaxID=2569539 RepID=A0A4U1BFY6_9GAMM|nr:bifunctional adenosylcobinamide kinase/adenosylcobinamide-phosphate guanylyltransferase [Ferrimonas aestuarii]TKB50073.1 bifunctional adenosylcobinamide kinase/adenosylcobinamide-phosphate guanylyltransferase [Ferrimonas aestuarii]
MKRLVIGGARSGKSRLAQQWASDWQQRSGGDVVVIATAELRQGGGSMAERIAHHRANRPSDWITVEQPRDLGLALAKLHGKPCFVMVDCLTLWLANELESGLDAYAEARAELLEALESVQVEELVMIGNELGQSVVPMGAETRQFVDQNGWLLQATGELCDQVTMVIAGQPLPLKGGL